MNRATLRSRASQSLSQLQSIQLQPSLPSPSPPSRILTIPSDKPVTNPLYNFLPDTQNPNNLVSLICSSLKQQNPTHFPFIPPTDLASIVPHLGFREISQVLLRCQSQSHLSLAFFNWVRNDLGITPHAYHYGIIVHTLTWSRNFREAMGLLLELIGITSSDDSEKKVDVFKGLVTSAEQCNWNPVVFDMLIKAYVHLGLIRDGYTVLKKMVGMGFAPHIVAFNFLLYGLSRENCFTKCWEIYEEIWRSGLVPNTITFNIMTHVICRDGDVDKVNEFVEKMEELGFEPDLVTYNTLIANYCRKGRLDDAFYLYKIMYRRRVIPDVVTYTTLINGVCRYGNVKEAHQIFHRMGDRGLEPDIVAYNCLVAGYCKEGKMKEARGVLHEMIRDGITPDGFTCEVLVDGYGREGQWLSALNMVVELKRYEVSISRNVYDDLVVSLCKGDHPFAALKLLDRAIEDRFEPSKHIYENIVKSLCKSDFIDEALRYKNVMVENNMKLSLSVYQSVITALCGSRRCEEAEILMQEMMESGLEPDCTSTRAILSGYCKGDDIDKAESLLLLLAMEFRLFDLESYNVVMRKLSEKGDPAKLFDLQDRLLKLGFAPNILTCKYVLDGLWNSVAKKGSTEGGQLSMESAEGQICMD